MKLFSKNVFLYGCNSKQEFESTKHDREIFNHKVWSIVVAILGIYFVILHLTTYSVDVVSANDIVYLVFAFICAAAFLLFRTFVKPGSKWLLPLIYFVMLSMFAFGIVIGIFKSLNFLAVTFQVLLIGVPLLIVDMPIKITIVELIVTIVFITLTSIFKTGDTKQLDIFNAVIFAAIAQQVNLYINATKISQFLTMLQIESASVTDDLTGIYNRKAYNDDLAEIGSEELREDLVIVSFDVNGLKVVNDTYGHMAGDELIKGTAECIKACLAPFGKVYRTGGDEYAAIINLSPEQLKACMEKLCECTSNWKGEYINKIEVSAGCAIKAEHPEVSVMELIKIADHDMYKKKAEFYCQKGADRRVEGRIII